MRDWYGLFTPAGNKNNKEKRIKAAEKTIAKNDQKTLVKIAMGTEYEYSAKSKTLLILMFCLYMIIHISKVLYCAGYS